MKREPFEMDGEFDHFRHVIGMDEVGRGCLAGPVVTACVSWSPRAIKEANWFGCLADSKLLKEKERDFLFPYILKFSKRIRVAVVNHILVDELNVLKATLHGFELIAPPYCPQEALIVDGNQAPYSLKWAKTVVKGDQKVSAVAAAGIVAKVVRDRMMVNLAENYPNYHFGQNKGYGTASHMKALVEVGACPFHRKSFRPISGFKTNTQLESDALAQLHGLKGFHSRWLCLLRNYHLISKDTAHWVLKGLHQEFGAVLPTCRSTVL